ncbi:gp16 family protein [Desulfatibacillum aliphaticivorans]|uniref:gp16 family protein n=1 Tax=Desulfatibacillum aliphaticivorans TaxID=218208 RepID=UPI0004297EA9|nr:regulatory protein GemA [Desulfatibacillum aliphaticivorans]
MTNQPNNYAVWRKKQLAKIHIAKDQLGMDETTYREMLHNVAKVKSSKDLDANGFRAVLEHLANCGFKATRKKRNSYPGRPKNMDSKSSRSAQLKKIEAYLAEAGRPWAYADSMAKRICKVDRIAWVDTKDLYKIITALRKDAQRHGRDKEA